MNSALSGFYKLTPEERRQRVLEQLPIAEEQAQALWGKEGLDLTLADQLVENVVGTMSFPLGVGLYAKINGKDRIVPMVTEESSVVAAASNALKMLRAGGGIQAESSAPIMIGQIQLVNVSDPKAVCESILAAKGDLLQKAAEIAPNIIKRGGGPRDLEVRHLPPMEQNDPLGDMVVAHILVDVCDAMGANLINTICEGLAPMLEQLSGCSSRLRILSNLSDKRTVSVKGYVPVEAFCPKGQPRSFGIATAQGIEEASVFAERDPYRAATHNKGIMNGVDAVLLATGQDFRAIESGAHAYAARNGRYTALSQWRVVRDEQGEITGLSGEMTIPMAVGVVGGITRLHPTVGAALKCLGIEKAHELAEVAATVGLAQNMAALRALAMEGIQKGHMGLHAKNLAAEEGALSHELDWVVAQMKAANTITRQAAREYLETLRKDGKSTAE